MSLLTAKSILDRVSSRIEDNSPELRVKLLGWLNQVMHDVATAKVNDPWEFLKKTKTGLTIADNMIAKPTDFDEVINVKIGSARLLEAKHKLSDEEAFRHTDTNAVNPLPVGFTLNSTSIVFWPGATGTADLKYICEVPEYADDTTATVFPAQMVNVLVYGALNQYFEYDADPQFANAPRLYEHYLSKAKRWDNSKKPLERMNRRGYLRTR